MQLRLQMICVVLSPLQINTMSCSTSISARSITPPMKYSSLPRHANLLRNNIKKHFVPAVLDSSLGNFKLSTPHRMLCKLQSKHCTVAVILLDCRLTGQPAWQTSRLQTILCRGAFCKSDSMAALAYTSCECTHWCTTKIAESICKHLHATLILTSFPI